MSSRLVSREWDNRNRWCDGQVCPEVGQGIMVPWSRRSGCVFGCYGQIGLGRPRETLDTKGRKKPCPGSRGLERRALVGTEWKRALAGENTRRALKKGTWNEIGVDRKERR
ncbi:hypothetical protein TNCV_2691871 [Trichonephila clavipes]|uniref:Uncharacterized protein n=1 Tax=Trichonephila clavipes TaxID=2585209 RepID=A0A8X6VZ24_TRICX|nr:hypothetical protein TNCV_2691871 [Trichonephila clavipes]